jgi:hypothetical protein
MADEQRNTFSAAEKLPDTSAADRRAIERQSRPSAALIHETIRAEGESELERTVPALLLSGLAAGLTMGFSLVAEGLLRTHLPDAPWRDLIAHFGYTVGFLIVVLGRQQLFTENTLTPILPLLYHRDTVTLGRVARLWAAVLVANVVGTWIFAEVIAHTEVFTPEAKTAFREISQKSIAHPFATTVLKAIFAAWLIALMAVAPPGRRDGAAGRDHHHHVRRRPRRVRPHRRRLGRRLLPGDDGGRVVRRLRVEVLRADPHRQRHRRGHPRRGPQLRPGPVGDRVKPDPLTPSRRRPSRPSWRRECRAALGPFRGVVLGLVLALRVDLAPSRTMIVESQIQVMKPMAAPSEP